MTFDEFLTPPEDPRPVIDICEECRHAIRGACDGYDADEYGEIDGVLLHRDCVMDYFDNRCRKD